MTEEFSMEKWSGHRYVLEISFKSSIACEMVTVRKWIYRLGDRELFLESPSKADDGNRHKVTAKQDE